jgi:predicted metal-binding membrane protein
MPSQHINIKREMVKHIPLLAVGASAVAWAALFAATQSDTGSELFHSSMTLGSTAGSTAEFLGAWETMVIAMMLPSSLGFLMLFRTATSTSRFAPLRRTAVCVGYALVWAAVGCLALVASGAFYRIQNLGAWLELHPNLLAGSVLVLAGAFQFTALKRRCLAVCSQPASFLMRHYRRGVGNALILGMRYGLLCLGCCWALMTMMVVVGGQNLYLMMVLSAIMFAERMLGWDDRFATLVGMSCIALGIFLVVVPDAMPALAQNAGKWIAMETLQLPHHGGWSFWCQAS